MATKRRKQGQRKSTLQHAGGSWTRGFLAALARNGNVTKSAELVHKDRSFMYIWRNKHPEFAAQWDAALEESYDRLEHEARRRAQFGSLKPVFYKGNVVGFEQEYSDQLMALMLKAKRPDEYGDKLTIRISPEQAAIFKDAGINPTEAVSQFLEMLKAEALANADHDGD